jgi:hypothetical protein
VSGLSGSSQIPLDLAMPGAQRSLRHWVGEAANRPGTPLRTVPAPEPQVIFAERKPRLTRSELLARHGVADAAPAPAARPSLSVVGAPEAHAPRRAARGIPRLGRWLTVLATALLAISGAPLF